MERLSFIPTSGQFFLYDEQVSLPGLRSTVGSQLVAVGWPGRASLLRGGTLARSVEGTLIELLDALPFLAGLSAGERTSPSMMAWAQAARAALALVLRGRFLPRLRARPVRQDDERAAGWEARWAVVLSGADRGLVGRLAQALGPLAVALPCDRRAAQPDRSGRSHAGAALVRRFLDRCADTLVREAIRRGACVRLGGWPADAWEQRLVRALGDDRAGLVITDLDPAQLADELRTWAAGEAEGPSLLPSPPSWRAPESLQAVLRRMQAPATQLAERLLRGEPAPRTLTAGVPGAAARIHRSIAIAQTLLRMTGPDEQARQRSFAV